MTTTKTTKGSSKAASPKVRVVAQPIHVDGTNRRHGDDGLEGHFVKVVSGEHAGRVGAFIKPLTHADDGYPDQILVRSRDEHNEDLVVAHKDVVATSYHGGR